MMAVTSPPRKFCDLQVLWTPLSKANAEITELLSALMPRLRRMECDMIANPRRTRNSGQRGRIKKW
jgi:hypothetical protein